MEELDAENNPEDESTGKRKPHHFLEVIFITVQMLAQNNTFGIRYYKSLMAQSILYQKYKTCKTYSKVQYLKI